MTVLDFILFGLLGIGVAGLGILLVKKAPILRVTDPMQLKRLGQQVVKHKLSEARLKRKFGQLGRATSEVAAAVWRRVHSSPQAEAEHEERTLEERLAGELKERTSPKRTTAEHLALAHEALEQEDMAEAEEAYLKAIELDPHNIEAYQGLGEVYLENRDYEAAREVFEYLAERGGEVTSTLGLARVAQGQGKLEEAKGAYLKSLAITTAVQPRLELVRILRELGQLNEALVQLNEARKIEPNNPKILDLFVELSILSGRPDDAQGALDQLREANPENQKIATLAGEIRKLREKLKPRKARRSHARSETFGLPKR